MSDDPNLFEKTAFDDMMSNGEVTFTKKTYVVKTHWLTIDGVKYDLTDLYTTVSEIAYNSDTVITDTGELVEKSAKSCKIRWPDGGLGIYDYEGNDFFVITPK